MRVRWLETAESMTLVKDDPAFAEMVRSFFDRLQSVSPFYRQRIAEAGIELARPLELLSAMPVTTKADYRDALQAEALSALQSRFFISDYSSGSTDACVLRFSSVREELAEQVITEQVFRRAGMQAGDRFVCLEVGAPEIYDFYGRAARNMGAEQTTYLKVTKDYAASFDPLRRLNPQVVLTLPSLMIKAWPTVKCFWPHGQSPIRSFIHMGEALHPELKREIEAVWGCKVYSFYGTTELGGLGGECAHGNGCHFDPQLICPTLMHAHEILPGVWEGEGFFTTLHFQHQTVVKYRAGDVVQVDLNPCACGEQTPRLRFVERTNDSFILTGDKFRYDVVFEALRAVVPAIDLLTIRLSDVVDSDQSLMTLVLPEAVENQRELILETMRYEIFELNSIYHYGFVDFALEFVSPEAFGERKMKRVIDERAYFT